MSGEQVSIITDGTIDLTPELVQQLGIIIVPCHIQIGGSLYESNAQTPLQAIAQQVGGSRRASIVPPPSNLFTRVYRDLGSTSLLSIHASGALGEISHAARLARNLLISPRLSGIYEEQAFKGIVLSTPYSGQPRQITIFESKAIDLGVRFMVIAAAQAAQEGYIREQIELFLTRLQDEAIWTFIVTRDLSRLEPFPWVGLSAGDKKGRPKGESLFSIDKTTGYFRLEAQDKKVGSHLLTPGPLTEKVPRPCEVWLRHSGFDEEVSRLYHEGANLFGAQGVYVTGDGPGVASYFNDDYLEVVFCPTADTIERLKRFAKRMWAAFGAEATASASSSR
jgi:hypothetical protein